MSKKPVLLCIMDGFGWTPNETYGNAVVAAKKPFLDSLMAKYPMTTIDASGMAVGLPDGQMGNSEVGHTNMGAGRIVYQQLTLITKSIRDGEMLKNPVLVKNMKAAIDAGIPVLAVDTNVGIAGQTSFVGTSNVDAAYEGGKWAIEQVGTDAKAVIIYGQEGDNTSNMRMEGYEKACTEAGVEVLAKLSGNNLTDGATKAMEDLLSAYPDQIDIVLCHNDDTAIGAMNACKSAGVSDITIVGFDGNASAVKLILDGELVKATVAQQPYEMGYQVVEAAVKAVKGESVDEVINAPVQVVTAENGQAYLDNLEAMKG